MGQLFTWTCINQTSWLVCGLSIFGAQMSHGRTRIHKIHHSPNLGEATTFPIIVFLMISHRGCIQMSLCPRAPKLGKLGVLKFPKLRLSALWKVITSCADFRLKWNPKQSYRPCRKLFNDMWHVTCTHVFQGDSQLLVGGSQIDTLTFDPSFGHNLCFNHSNGSCESI